MGKEKLMAKLKIIDLKNGKEKSSVDAEDTIFKLPLRKDLLNDYVIMQRRAQRAGTHNSKTRSEVSGTGKKPFRQKGTGNARQGSLKGPHQEGGGVVFGPKPRKYYASMNKKMKKLAIKTALSQKNYETKLGVIEGFDISSGKTKDAAKTLGAVTAKSYLVVGNFNELTLRSVRNLGNAKFVTPNYLNVRDILKYDQCLITQEALTWIQENFKEDAKEKAA